jgi:methyl-accepting chemotaxis protein
MKRLSQDQLAIRDDLSKRLREIADEIKEAVDDANTVIDKYNQILADVEEFRGEVVGEMETYIDDNSEKWRDSEAGSNYQDWKSRFEMLDLTELHQIEVPKTVVDDLDELPDEPEA